MLLLAAPAFACACGSGAAENMPPRHLSAAEHHNEALRHEREAVDASTGTGETKSGARTYGCYDQSAEVPEPTDGGERIPVLRPCWTAETQPKSDRQREAAEHRREAARHRAMAAELWRAERESCSGLGEDEISHSPFFHREDIARVEPLRSGGQIRGARVVFRPVPGLDVDWMRKAIACHQARAAALGYPPSFMTYCPLMAAPTTATVEQRGTEIVVTISALHGEEAAAVLGRAQALIQK